MSKKELETIINILSDKATIHKLADEMNQKIDIPLITEKSEKKMIKLAIELIIEVCRNVIEKKLNTFEK